MKAALSFCAFVILLFVHLSTQLDPIAASDFLETVKKINRGLPPVKVHCSLLAEEAIHAALWDYAQKHGIVIEGLDKPKSDISEGEEEEEY